MIRIPGSIPISIYPLFWLLAAAIGWINTFNVLGTSIWMGIIFVSVLVHEYGHALTAIFFGQRAQIDLVAMGGITQRHGGKLKLWQDFIIVLNGPLAGLCLGLLALFLKMAFIAPGTTSLASYALQVMFYVNVFWTIINLVPVQPLDGGKLLGIVLESLFGLRGIKIALFISMVLSVILGLFFFSIHAVLAGVIFLMLAFEGYRSWQQSLPVTEQDQNLILQHLLKEAERDLQQGRKEESLNKFQRIRDLAKSGVIYINATERAAILLAEKGAVKEAYDMLMPIKHKVDVDALRLLHQLAYQQGRWQEAVSLGTRSYQTVPNYETALINSFCFAILGEVGPAVGWLQCAIKEGLPNLKEILHQREFDNIRNDPLFRKLEQE